MNEQTLRRLADALWDAQRSCQPMDPPTDILPLINSEDAYAIQMLNIRRRLAGGAKIIGKKIGLTSLAMQEALGVGEPDFGHLMSDMRCEQDMPIALRLLIAPKVEAEVAFIMGKALSGPGVQAADVLDACEGLMAAFEIVDSRVRDWRIRLEDTVADNASSGSFVLGSRMLGPDEIDLETVRMELAKNGDVIASATGSAVMGHPARAVAWLANKLTELGSRIEPGDIILSGSLTKAWDVLTGDVFCASFGPLGKVTASFI
jgi:2-keto-4-pentenoate hydratase